MVSLPMTRRKKTLVYGAIAFVICVGLIVTTAYSQGADPFHPRSRHIWALSLIAALYASFRGATIVERMLHAANKSDSDGGDTRAGGLRLFKNDREIDKRMAARKQRVAAARAKAAEADDAASE